MRTNWDLLIENHFARKGKKEESLTLEALLESVREVMGEESSKDPYLLSEAEDPASAKRFSFSIPIPRLVPSEAWGDPSSQSRKDIDRIFASITRKPSIKARIDHVNSFLDPKQAIRKAPGGKVNTVLNMLQIIEALQATLNDYNESSAGFVFEGFMAALTGGRQEAGRVGGTLPIEDFVTADNENVSLKLLSPNTPIHGSFTNLIDYLFIRGETGVPSIKYLIAFKNEENDAVANLAFWDFEINRGNIIDILETTGNGGLFEPVGKQLKRHIGVWQDSPKWKLQMKGLLSKTTGYSPKGMFYKNLTSTGVFDEREGATTDPAVKQHQYQLMLKQGRLDLMLAAAEKEGANAAKAGGPTFADWEKKLDLTDLPASQRSQKRQKFLADLDFYWNKGFESAHIHGKDEEESAGPIAESYFGAFHEDEKRYMREDTLLEGKGEGKKSQFSISREGMNAIKRIAETRFFGELNMSQNNIRELSQIYIEKIGEDLMTLLENTKNFSENIGRYFSADDRKEAMLANKTAIDTGAEIITSLEADPAGPEE